MQETEYRAYLNNIALTKDSQYFSPDIYTPEPDHIKLETIERCRVCLKGFKSKWGDIHKCIDHEGLEEIHMPMPMSELKKISSPKRKRKEVQTKEYFGDEFLEDIEMIDEI